MSVKIVIPARYGSSRLPGKPLLLLANKSVFLHVVDRCVEAGFSISDIFIATDHAKILKAAQDAGINAIMTSPSHQSGTDRLNEVATKQKWPADTIVLNVQGDEPLIPPKLIHQVVSFTNKTPNFSITTAVTPILSAEEFTNKNVVKAIMGENNRAVYFTRSSAPMNRDQPDDLSLAMRHIGIYAYRVNALQQFCQYEESSLEAYEKLEQLRALSHGMSIGATIFNDDIPHGIDTEEDYKCVKEIIEKRKFKGHE